MKTKNIILLLLLLFVTAVVAVSCNEKPEIPPIENGQDPEKPKDPEENYPIEISFTEYSLTSTSCQWTNLIYDDKLIVVNSDEILRAYITCTDGSYPEIDFSKWTLLVFNVECCNIDSYVKKMLLQQLSDNNYLLSIDIIPSTTANAAPLIISILIPKISNDGQIELNIKNFQN